MQSSTQSIVSSATPDRRFNMENFRREPDSPAWLFCVRATFCLAITSTGIGIYHLPADAWIRGFMAMAALFLTGSSFTLAKTLRDQHEATKLTKKIDDIQTEKILRDHALHVEPNGLR